MVVIPGGCYCYVLGLLGYCPRVSIFVNNYSQLVVTAAVEHPCEAVMGCKVHRHILLLLLLLLWLSFFPAGPAGQGGRAVVAMSVSISNYVWSIDKLFHETDLDDLCRLASCQSSSDVTVNYHITLLSQGKAVTHRQSASQAMPWLS